MSSRKAERSSSSRSVPGRSNCTPKNRTASPRTRYAMAARGKRFTVGARLPARRRAELPAEGPSAAYLARELTHVGQVTEALGDVEAVAEHERRRDLESDVSQLLLGLLVALAHEERA